MSVGASPSTPLCRTAGEMRALILVGGYGTRLRPLTLTTPKPLVPFCNKPMIIHQVEALHEAGVTDIILAVAYRSEEMKSELDKWGVTLGVRFIYSVEDVPLGTAGPLALARDELMKDSNPFFVLNSDVTCRFPLKELLSVHMKHQHEGTICVTKVNDWSKYGVIVYNENTGLIDQFVEKPTNFVGDRINAGIYIFNKSVLNRIQPTKTSIETQIFPQMASAKELYAFPLEGFWMDIGQPHDYIKGIGRLLSSYSGTAREAELLSMPVAAELGIVIKGCVAVHPTAFLEAGSVIGPNVTIGPRCVVGCCCRISNSAVFENTTIGKGCLIENSIIGWNNRVGSWCRITNNTVLADDVETKSELRLNGIKVLPNKTLSKNYDDPEVVM